MFRRIFLDIRSCNKKGGYDTRFAAKKFQIGICLDFVKKKKSTFFYRKKLKILGVTMCNASVNYPKYSCSPVKNGIFFSEQSQGEVRFETSFAAKRVTYPLFYCKFVFLTKFYIKYSFTEKFVQFGNYPREIKLVYPTSLMEFKNLSPATNESTRNNIFKNTYSDLE